MQAMQAEERVRERGVVHLRGKFQNISEPLPLTSHTHLNFNNYFKTHELSCHPLYTLTRSNWSPKQTEIADVAKQGLM